MLSETPPVTMVRHRGLLNVFPWRSVDNASDNSQTTLDPAAEGGPRLLLKVCILGYVCIALASRVGSHCPH